MQKRDYKVFLNIRVPVHTAPNVEEAHRMATYLVRRVDGVVDVSSAGRPSIVANMEVSLLVKGAPTAEDARSIAVSKLGSAMPTCQVRCLRHEPV